MSNFIQISEQDASIKAFTFFAIDNLRRAWQVKCIHMPSESIAVMHAISERRLNQSKRLTEAKCAVAQNPRFERYPSAQTRTRRSHAGFLFLIRIKKSRLIGGSMPMFDRGKVGPTLASSLPRQ